MSLFVAPGVEIPDGVLEEWFIRGSGPGGQNVNKVATAVELRLDVARAPLPEGVKRRLRALAGNRLSGDGILAVESREHRTQGQNRQAARERLAALIRLALVPPKPRRATRPSAASKERRVQSKQRRGRVKALRSKTDED